MLYEHYSSRDRFWLVAVLFCVSTLSYADRNILAVVIEGIKREFRLSDTMVGLLIGAPFAIFFSIFGVPIARLADRHDRRAILLACLAVWSCSTILCGFASGVWMLLAARMLVGASEAGTAPTTHSLVADYCAPAQRSRAYSALAASSAIGGFLALTGGGYIANQFGWRAAFLGVGGLSLFALTLAAFILKEPRNHSNAADAHLSVRAPLLADVRALISKPSYLLLVAGMTLYSFIAYGPLLLAPTYLIRVLRVDVAQAGLIFGPALGVGTLFGSLIGGFLGDRCVQRNILWLVRLPALGLTAALPAGLVAFSTDSAWLFLLASSVMVTMITACLPVVFSAVQAVCGSQRRALAVALMFGALNMIGMTIGPLLTGWLSDIFSSTQGVVGLRSAIITVLWLLIPASAITLTAGRSLLRDVET